MLEYVNKSVKDKNFVLNMVMHSMILFSFLSVFFIYYITTLTDKAFKEEVTHLMDSSLEEASHAIKQNKNVQETLEKLPIDNILNSYKKPHKQVQALNKGLFKVVFTVNIMLWVFLVLSLYIFNSILGIGIDIKHVIIENAIVFSIVGVVEYLFFKMIAFKFVPVEPSFISKQFLEKLKKKFE